MLSAGMGTGGRPSGAVIETGGPSGVSLIRALHPVTRRRVVSSNVIDGARSDAGKTADDVLECCETVMMPEKQLSPAAANLFTIPIFLVRIEVVVVRDVGSAFT